MSEEFSRYRSILTQLSTTWLDLVEGCSPVAQLPPPLDSMDRTVTDLSTAAAKLLLFDDAALYPRLTSGFKTLAAVGRAWSRTGEMPQLVDPLGQGRNVYHPLSLHLHLAAFARRFEVMPAGIWSACEDALAEATMPVRQIESYTDMAPPVEQIDLVLWQALCMTEQAILAGRDVDLEVADSVVHQVVSRPGDSQSLHIRRDSESLDTWASSELCGLHALANLALRRRQSSWAQRVEQIATFHVNHTETKTDRPWGVFAFLWSRRTRRFAERQLDHATTFLAGCTPSDARGGAVSGLLLADAVDALGAFSP